MDATLLLPVAPESTKTPPNTPRRQVPLLITHVEKNEDTISVTKEFVILREFYNTIEFLRICPNSCQELLWEHGTASVL